jgi:hypothetical protein
MKEHSIQDFAVAGGVIARNEEGLIEGRLQLNGGFTFTFVMDIHGAQWYWQPTEPSFVATRLGTFGRDVGEPGAEELRLLAEHGVVEDDYRRLQMLDAAQEDLVATL